MASKPTELLATVPERASLLGLPLELRETIYYHLFYADLVHYHEGWLQATVLSKDEGEADADHLLIRYPPIFNACRQLREELTSPVLWRSHGIILHISVREVHKKGGHALWYALERIQQLASDASGRLQLKKPVLPVVPDIYIATSLEGFRAYLRLLYIFAEHEVLFDHEFDGTFSKAIDTDVSEGYTELQVNFVEFFGVGVAIGRRSGWIHDGDGRTAMMEHIVRDLSEGHCMPVDEVLKIVDGVCRELHEAVKSGKYPSMTRPALARAKAQIKERMEPLHVQTHREQYRSSARLDA